MFRNERKIFFFNIYLCASEQQLVDCSSAQGNAGCDGGWYDSAWEHLKTNELVSIDNYPYTSGKTGVVRKLFIHFKTFLC